MSLVSQTAVVKISRDSFWTHPLFELIEYHLAVIVDQTIHFVPLESVFIVKIVLHVFHRVRISSEVLWNCTFENIALVLEELLSSSQLLEILFSVLVVFLFRWNSFSLRIV